MPDVAPEAATPPVALADDLNRLAAEHVQKAAGYDRDSARECFHRGCSAGLANAAGRLRHDVVPAWDALAAQLAEAQAVVRDMLLAVTEYADSEQDTEQIARWQQRAALGGAPDAG